MSDAVPDPKPFRYDAEVEPGEKRRIRYEIGETYLGDPIEIPVTIINGEAGGPTLFLSAGIHGDELNGVKVVQEVADRYSPGDLHGTLVCLPRVTSPPTRHSGATPHLRPGHEPVVPGKERSNTTERMANRIYRRFVAQCDLGLDFHTSTQNRTTIYHARADLDNPEVRRLARAYATNVVLYGSGDDGVAPVDGDRGRDPDRHGRDGARTPVPAGAHREGVGGGRERPRRVRAHARRGGPLAGVVPVDRRRQHKAVAPRRHRRTRRDGVGPLPARLRGRDDLHHHEPLQNGGARDRGPFDGLIVGSLENPVAAPGHPLCHVVKLDAETRREIEREIDNGEFDGYRAHGDAWADD